MNQGKIDEMGDTLGGEVARSAKRTANLAATFENIPQQAFDVSMTIFGDASSSDVRRAADALDGLVLRALAMVAEMQRIAGCLATCADLRAAEGAAADERVGTRVRRKNRR